MATFRNRHGKWQARVQRKGQQPVSKSFQSKEDAQRWARQVEAEIDKGSYTNIALAERTLFKDVIERYVQEVTLKTRSMKEDTYRLRALARHPIANLRMTALTPIKVWLKTNHKPVVKEDDDGIWRRLIVIPFGRKFTEEERDPNLEEKLIKEADGILMWIIEGAVQWHKGGLDICQTIKQESSEYRTESDLLGHFLDEKIEFNDASRAIETEVYFYYQNWCRANGTNRLSKIRFTQKLKERGIRQLASNGKRCYSGIKLVEFNVLNSAFEPAQVVQV